jgi:hypothetical protein
MGQSAESIIMKLFQSRLMFQGTGNVPMLTDVNEGRLHGSKSVRLISLGVATHL